MDIADPQKTFQTFQQIFRSSEQSRNGPKGADVQYRSDIPSTSADWAPVLAALRITQVEAERIEKQARLAGVPFQVELLASGIVGEAALFRQLAAELGVPYDTAIDPASLVMRNEQGLSALSRHGGVRMAMAMERSGQTVLLLAPDRLNVAELRNFIRRYPADAARVRIVSPSVLRKAVSDRLKAALSKMATEGLFDRFSHYSARFVVNAGQGAVLGAVTVTLILSMLLVPSLTILTLHGLLSTAFLACVTLRLVIGHKVLALKTPSLKAFRPSEMPVYTVLIALYKEADIVPDLLVALGRIVWPRSKLEIKLVCESDDTETINAIRAQELRPYIEVIEVPPGGPRTKPKALSYALPMTSGALVALYDAEDKPHPFQLVEAWQRFCEGDEKLACLQAPLVISNRRESWISAMFALEYSALFRGVLPWLASRGLILPLGGTSNHFRRHALEAVGGWDPCNVTEDADLGMRLHRLGYRTDVISNPTYEDAPTDMRTWIPQRTRWFKGWAQTWLVHMRSPTRLIQELGVGSFIIAQILFAGMVLSSLAYSVFLLTAAWLLAQWIVGGVIQTPHAVLLVIDAVNIICGFGAFLALGWWTLTKTERQRFWKRVLWTPFYWGLLSVAAWRCLWQLYRRPHHWEKTPHKPRRHLPSSADGQFVMSPRGRFIR